MSDLISKIDAFLDGELSPEEMQIFEKKAAEDQLLAEELQLQKEMRALYSDTDWVASSNQSSSKEHDLLVDFFKSDEAKELKRNIKEPLLQRKLKKQKRKWYLYVAAASMLLMVSLVVNSLLFNPSTEELYAAYLDKTEMSSFVSRGSVDEVLQKGQELFENNAHKEAVDIFNSYLTDVKDANPEVYTYLAMSHTKLQQYDMALHNLELLANTPTLASKKANWFKALVYLKMGDLKEAKKVLTVLSNDSNSYKNKEAQEILKQLED